MSGRTSARETDSVVAQNLVPKAPPRTLVVEQAELQRGYGVLEWLPERGSFRVVMHAYRVWRRNGDGTVTVVDPRP